MKLKKFPTVGAVVMIVAACSQYPQPAAADTDTSALGPDKVATVNGAPIPTSVYRFYVLSNLKRDPDKLTDEQRKQVEASLIQLKLLEQAAEKQGIPQQRTIAAELALERSQSLARAFVSQYLQAHPPTQAELEAAYKKNLPEFTATQYRAAHILLKTKQEAEGVIKELNKGGNFAKLAKERSTGPTGPKGGELGYFTAESMVKPFADAVKSMKVGTYTHEPVHTQFGWHVIKLEDIKKPKAPGLDAVRKDLVSIVDREKIQAYIDSLKKAAKISMD